jgi:hypothetical protein
MALADFTDGWTEVDPDGVITATATQVSWGDLTRLKVSYYVKDYGVDFFNTDFVHQFEIVNDDMQGTGYAFQWGMSNYLGSHKGVVDNLEDKISFFFYQTGEFICQVLESGVETYEHRMYDFTPAQGTTYYVTVQRVHASNLYRLYVRTGSHNGPIVGSIAVKTPLTHSWRYLYVCQTAETGLVTDTIDGSVTNLELAGTAPSKQNPYEDFTTFTVNNESDRVANGVLQVSCYQVQRTSTNFYSKDYGAGFFTGDYDHKFLFYAWDIENVAIYWPYVVANTENTGNALIAASQDMVGVYSYESAGQASLRLLISDDGASTEDVVNINEQTLYYCNLNRDNDGGTNNTGRYTLTVRTGSHTGTLIGTATVDCGVGEQNDYRYFITGAAGTSGTTKTTAIMSNLDLGGLVSLRNKDLISLQPKSR